MPSSLVFNLKPILVSNLIEVLSFPEKDTKEALLKPLPKLFSRYRDIYIK